MVLAKLHLLAAMAIIGLALASPTFSERGASLSLRSDGTVAEWFDQEDLVRRAGFALTWKAVILLGGITYTACNSNTPPVAAGLACVLGVVGSIAAVFASIFFKEARDLGGVDPALATLPQAMIHHYPAMGGQSSIAQLSAHFTGEPLLVMNSPCEYTGCHNVHYMNRLDARGNMLHELTASPRHDTSGAFPYHAFPKRYPGAMSKRQENEDSGSQDGLYGHYTFYDDSNSDEKSLGDDPNFQNNVEAATNDEGFQYQGAYCYDFQDTDTGNRATGGYLVMQQDQITLPDQDGEEQSWLDECNNM